MVIFHYFSNLIVLSLIIHYFSNLIVFFLPRIVQRASGAAHCQGLHVHWPGRCGPVAGAVRGGGAGPGVGPGLASGAGEPNGYPIGA